MTFNSSPDNQLKRKDVVLYRLAFIAIWFGLRNYLLKNNRPLEDTDYY